MKKYTIFLKILFAGIFIISCTKQETADELIYAAEISYAAQNYRSAKLELKKAIQEEPGNASARMLLGKVYLVVGDYPGAEKEFRRAMELGIIDIVSIEGLGRSLIGQGKYKEALNEANFENVVNNQLKSAVFAVYGDAYLGMGDRRNALQNYQGSLKLDEKNFYALIGLAKIKIIEDDYQAASDLIDAAKKYNGENDEVLVVQGFLLLKKEQYADAKEKFLLVVNSGKSDRYTQEIFNAYINLIHIMLSQNELESLPAVVDAFLKKAPTHPIPVYFDALVNFQNRKYEVAQSKLQLVLKNLPDHLPSIYLLGATNFAQGNYEQANSYLTKYLQYVPTHLMARKLLAVTRIRLNKAEEALESLNAPIADGVEDIDLLIMAGQAAANLGDMQTSIKMYQRASVAQPDNTLVREELAKIYLKEGLFDEAIAQLTKSTGKSKSLKTNLLLIQAHMQKGEYDQAKAIVNSMMDGVKKSAELYTLLGLVELHSGNNSLAIVNFRNASSMSQSYIPSRLYLARIELENGNLTNAADLFSDILAINNNYIPAIFGMAQISEIQGDQKAAEDWLKKAAAMNSTNSILVLGYYYLKTKQYAQALQLAESINVQEMKEDKNPIILFKARTHCANAKYEICASQYEELLHDNNKSSSIYSEYAISLIKTNKKEQAKKILLKALTENPDNLPAQIMLFDIEVMNDSYDDAVNIANIIAKKYPKKAVGYVLLGDLYCRTENPQIASKYYEKAIKIENQLTIYHKYIQCYMRHKDYRQAKSIARKALLEFPSDTEVVFLKATIFLSEGKAHEALALYEELYKKYPNDFRVLNNMSYIYLGNSPDKALLFAQKAYDLQPNNIAIIDTLAWALLKNNRPKESISYYDKIIGSTDNFTIQYHYAYANHILGNHEKAKAILLKIIQNGEEFPEYKAAITLLEQLE